MSNKNQEGQMTWSEAESQRLAMAELEQSSGWRDYLLPLLTKEIDSLMDSILYSEHYEAASREAMRNRLNGMQWILDQRDRLERQATELMASRDDMP